MLADLAVGMVVGTVWSALVMDGKLVAVDWGMGGLVDTVVMWVGKVGTV